MQDPNALKELLLKLADDQLILGHRNSEWTGMGPLLEEDIAFSSMAQDKIGHSQTMFTLLHQLGEPEPDKLAFNRNANEFRNCIMVEVPNGEYDFSLVRHLLFDTAERIRFTMLSESTYTPLREAAYKIKGELKYHTMHADSWIVKLGNGTSESIARLQSSLNSLLPYALGIFEPSAFEEQLVADGIFAGEAELHQRWQEKIGQIIRSTSLTLPEWSSMAPVTGGRRGTHSEHLQPLINEMTEVLRLDPNAQW